MELDMTILGARIREERTKRGLTIEELSELIDVSPSFLGLVERAERGLGFDKVFRLSKCLDVSIDSLVTNSVSDDELNRTDKLLALVSNLNDKDFDFVIEMVKLLKKRVKE
jgi:transcriptional regulator with XRE-family HTH domain